MGTAIAILLIHNVMAKEGETDCYFMIYDFKRQTLRVVIMIGISVV
jgi:hypothetical protein